jgi:hypothetical protein
VICMYILKIAPFASSRGARLGRYRLRVIGLALQL